MPAGYQTLPTLSTPEAVVSPRLYAAFVVNWNLKSQSVLRCYHALFIHCAWNRTRCVDWTSSLTITVQPWFDASERGPTIVKHNYPQGCRCYSVWNFER